jgi:peptidyl-prolyl cis-trans isomerase C
MGAKNYHVRHILLRHQYEAEDVLRKLVAGESFESLARKFSTCPSSAQGGDLGTLAFGRADSDFEEEVTRLKIGETSTSPVRTRFGYHIIWRIA